MKKYWEKRKSQRMWEHMQSAEDTADQIAKTYGKASIYLTQEMDKVFDRYKQKHTLSEEEAYQLLNMLEEPSVDELKKALKRSAKTSAKDELIKRIEAPAYSSRISRLQELQDEIDSMMKMVYNQEKSLSTRHYIKLANNAYYTSVFDIQQATGIGFRFNSLSPKLIDKLLKSKWSGVNYSNRIWKNTHDLSKTLKEELLVNLITGRTDREAAAIIQNKMRSGAYEARRLVRTESAFIANDMETASYEECGIDTYIFCATLDMKTSEICREHDGKRYKLKDKKTGVNCPPLHPWCRSTTIAGINDSALSKMKRRARDPETNELYQVPANMSYQEWLESVAVDESDIKNINDLKRKVKEKATSILTDEETKIVKFKDLNNDFQKNFKEGLVNSDSRVKELLKREVPKLDLVELSGGRSKSIKRLNVIKVDTKGDPSTLAHEIFHQFDNQMKITKDGLFGDLLREDYKNFLRLNENDPAGYLLKNYPNMFWIQGGKTRCGDEGKAISDIISGLTNNKINFGYGHSPEYWARKQSLDRESWAQFGRLMYQNDEKAVEIVKTVFPSYYKHANMKLEELVLWKLGQDGMVK